MSVPAERIFVFGSNLSGVHGAGAALHAKRKWGAQTGVGEGRSGQSYALPTKGKYPALPTLPLSAIAHAVDMFCQYARENPHLEFIVTAVGCGLAGLKAAQIAPMFAAAPDNCLLPPEFRRHLHMLPLPDARWWTYEEYPG